MKAFQLSAGRGLSSVIVDDRSSKPLAPHETGSRPRLLTAAKLDERPTSQRMTSFDEQLAIGAGSDPKTLLERRDEVCRADSERAVSLIARELKRRVDKVDVSRCGGWWLTSYAVKTGYLGDVSEDRSGHDREAPHAALTYTRWV